MFVGKKSKRSNFYGKYNDTTSILLHYTYATFDDDGKHISVVNLIPVFIMVLVNADELIGK